MTGVVLAVLACSTAAARTEPPTPARGARDASSRTVRVMLAEGQDQVVLTADVAWRIYAADGGTLVALTEPGERWILTREGRALRAAREDSRPVTARETTLIARALAANGVVGVSGRRYRGDLVITASDAGMLVVNRLQMDDYLRGVVPLEIGTSAVADVAAVEAQAITARSYAVTHLTGASRPFDMRATVADQVYGGASAETNVGNLAVANTSGLVLLYGGRVVNAPYFSTCGGTTAEPQDVWRTGGEPYLQRVSDQIPGSTHFYCENAPKYRWTQTLGRNALRERLLRYMRTLSAAPRDFTVIRHVSVTDVTPAGRVGVLTVETDRGTWALRGNEMRAALRLASGELLYSTYFSVDETAGPAGVEQLTLSGGGYGHGVGMCQAGAIGRARAGQDYRTILRTYYPGTTVGLIN